LYLSLYFKEHRQYYYDLLNSIRANGDWETWLQFFAEAVTTTATQAVASIRKLAEMAETDAATIATVGRAASSVRAIHVAMLERPIVSAGWLAEKTGLTPATVNKALARLEGLEIIRKLGDAKRNRLFAYSRYIDILHAESPS
jgi:Fic family protein